MATPGVYPDAPDVVYENGYAARSFYIPMRDGEELAADVYFPADENGAPIMDVAMPVLWTHDRYQRNSWGRDGNPRFRSSLAEALSPYGYIVADVDVRGGGASTGTRHEAFDQPETWDSKDVVDWFARQAWCDGNVGMYGRSYLGITQYMAASTQPANLKALMPEMAWFDLYDLVYVGGVYNDAYLKAWGEGVVWLDGWYFDDGGNWVPTDIPWDGGASGEPLSSFTAMPPLDTDWNGELSDAEIDKYYAARAEHETNTISNTTYSAMPYRDSIDVKTDSPFNIRSSAHPYYEAIASSNIPMYHYAGWHDAFVTGQLLWFQNLDKDPAYTAAQKLIVGPWHHGDNGDFDRRTEQLRWFDYALKGVDNGITDEPGIYYYTSNIPYYSTREEHAGLTDADKGEWQYSENWPPKKMKRVTYYLQGGKSGSIESVNDGRLSTAAPIGTHGSDDYTTDYTTTTGTPWTTGNGNRWTACYDRWMGGYGDMRANDAKGLTFTSDVLTKDMEMTGHVVINLWVSSTASDGDFFVYIQEVDPDGWSHYVAEGILRASHRKLYDITDPVKLAAYTNPDLSIDYDYPQTLVDPTEPMFWDGFDYFGLPYRRDYQRDAEELPADGTPVLLKFYASPNSVIFNKGNRIRVTITNADAVNFATPELDPAPVVTIYRNANYPSSVELPLIKGHRGKGHIKGHGKGHIKGHGH